MRRTPQANPWLNNQALRTEEENLESAPEVSLEAWSFVFGPLSFELAPNRTADSQAPRFKRASE
ncbi:MAG: hypothetical protein DME26_12115 [Verrucomicrobia bacterium]|nr:MAG: hypothetical protein DME26_12115 [Verrucomicrobiota bacterium]